ARAVLPAVGPHDPTGARDDQRLSARPRARGVALGWRHWLVLDAAAGVHAADDRQDAGRSGHRRRLCCDDRDRGGDVDRAAAPRASLPAGRVRVGLGAVRERGGEPAGDRRGHPLRGTPPGGRAGGGGRARPRPAAALERRAKGIALTSASWPDRLRARLLHPPLQIVLVEPEIPPNTGNVARLCAATGSVLHLVGKLGFRTDEHAVRRAGLDYWHLV